MAFSAIWNRTRRRAKTSRTHPSRAHRLRLEPLEDRVLLTAGSSGGQVQVPNTATGPASIHGTVFQDRTGTGTFATGDPGIAGRTVFLDLHHDGKLDPGDPVTVTSANGSFTFTNLAPGTYTVSQVVPPGWTATSYVAAATVLPATTAADQLIGLTQFRADPRFANITGQGESVVVLDTGIDSSNTAFGPVNNQGVAGSIVYQHDFTTGSNQAVDTNGHGTYVASVIGSRNAAYPGIAPGVNLIALKVLDNKGNGEFSNIDQALKWVIANASKYHITVVNMSFGDNGNYTTPQSLYGIGNDLATLAAADIIVVAAAGNTYAGSNAQPGLAYPAIDPNVIPVGAVWAANDGGPWVWSNGVRDNTTGPDRIVSFSQRLPGSGEVFAPGTLVTGAAPGGGTSTLSGTSTAAAVVSGVVALAQQLAMQDLGHLLSPTQMRNLLNSTGVPIRDGEFEDDNVAHTGAVFDRVDIDNLAQAIVAMGSVAPGPDAGSRVVNLPPGSTANVALGSFQLGTISGQVFGDTNANGKLDPGEKGLADHIVFVDNTGNGLFEPGDPYAHTDSTGHFTVTNLGPGPVTIHVEAWPNQQQTNTFTTTVTSGLDLTGINLGLRTNPANHAPVLTGNGQTATIAEGTTAPAGQNVSTLLGTTFQDIEPHTAPGMAVTGVNPAQGQWQFSLDGGQSWLNLGPVSLSAARLLSRTTRLRFVPAANFSGTATITYRAWDQTTGSVGAMADLTAGTGGSTAYSRNSATTSVIVKHVHQAPVLTGPGWIAPVTPGTANPQGTSVANLLTGTVVVDAGGKAGIALIGDTGQGTWQYSSDGGRSWSNLGTASFTSARLLPGTDRVRFLPAPNWTGQASLTYRAWDQTTGTAGRVINLPWALTGGTTAFSKEIESATLAPASASGGSGLGLA